MSRPARSIARAARAPADPARLFLALWPPAGVRAALQAWQARWTWPAGAALVAPERLHLTLHFLGAVPRARLPALAEALTPPPPRFELGLDAAQLWPHGLAVLCPQAPPADLLALQAALGDALRGLALPVEARDFRPHLTLARRAAGARPAPPAAALRWPVRDYALVESEPGGRYRVLQVHGADGGA